MLDERRFAASRVADDADKLAFLDAEIHMVEGTHLIDRVFAVNVGYIL